MDTAPAAPPNSSIDTDLPCCICDYNLKGLATDANCPECGNPNAQTLHFGLIHSDPAWLRRQAGVMPFLAALCLPNVMRNDFTYANFPAAMYTGHVLNIAASVVALVACYRLSVPDPNSVTAADEDGSIRRGLRLAALCLLVLNVAAFPLFHSALPGGTYERPSGFLSYVRPILLAITDVLALWLLTRLAHRSGSRSLRTHARIVLYVLPVVPLASLLAYATFVVDLRPVAQFVLALYQAFDFFVATALFAMLILLGRLNEVLRASSNGATMGF